MHLVAARSLSALSALVYLVADLWCRQRWKGAYDEVDCRCSCCVHPIFSVVSPRRVRRFWGLQLRENREQVVKEEILPCAYDPCFSAVETRSCVVTSKREGADGATRGFAAWTNEGCTSIHNYGSPPHLAPCLCPLSSAKLAAGAGAEQKRSRAPASAGSVHR